MKIITIARIVISLFYYFYQIHNVIQNLFISNDLFKLSHMTHTLAVAKSVYIIKLQLQNHKK